MPKFQLKPLALATFLLVFHTPVAIAKGRDVSGIPEFETFFNNIVALPALILSLLRVGTMLAGVFISVSALYFWVISSKILSGHQPKFISPQRIPSPLACVILLFSGVSLFLLGDGFFGLATAVNASTGEELQSVYSVVKYSNTKSTTEMLNILVLSLVKSIGVLVGFIGIMWCALDLRASSLQRKRHSTAKLLIKFFASGIIAMPIVLSDFVGNTIGFNVLRFLFQ